MSPTLPSPPSKHTLYTMLKCLVYQQLLVDLCTLTLKIGDKYQTNKHKHIITIEDPVEYKLSRVNQVQVNPKIDLTFAKVLRSVLRQDPDIILIGEMRDQETAEIGLRAAVTGHLVLSTLHTNDSLSAAVRLSDMGAEPYLLASGLRGVIAQRLVRRICNFCNEEYSPDEQEVSCYISLLTLRTPPRLGVTEKDVFSATIQGIEGGRLFLKY